MMVDGEESVIMVVCLCVCVLRSNVNIRDMLKERMRYSLHSNRITTYYREKMTVEQ